VDPSAYQRVIEENLDLRRQQERLARELDDVRRQNAALVLDAQDLERKREQLASLVAQLRTPDDARNEIARLEAEKVLLLQEVDRLRKAFGSVRVAPTNTPESVTPAPAAGSDLFRKLEQENAALRQEIVTARGQVQAEVEAGRKLQQRVVELEGEAKRVGEEAAAARAKGERAGKVADAYRKAVDKLARRAYQQEQEIRDLKGKTGAPGVAGAAGTGAQASPGAGGKAKVVQDRTLPGLLRTAEKALQAGKPEEAEKLYRQALDRDGKNPRLHYNLGVLYDDYLQQPRKAAQYYRQYLELDPDAGDADAVRAWIVDLETRM